MSTSSQLAMTAACGCLLMPSRSRRSIMLISPTRSSWSRERFSSTNACGSVASATWGTWSSSTSSAAILAGRFNDSAATIPASMLAPSAWLATSPSWASAAAVMRVVVDLPLVPVTITVRLFRASVPSVVDRSSVRRGRRSSSPCRDPSSATPSGRRRRPAVRVGPGSAVGWSSCGPRRAWQRVCHKSGCEPCRHRCRALRAYPDLRPNRQNRSR